MKMRKLVIYGAIALLAVVLLWRAEKEIRKLPQYMLPSWQVRYYANHAPKIKVLPDGEIGFLMRPNQHEAIQTPDFAFVRVTDNKGFPNRDPWPTQADIVFLGDSLLVGEGVGLAGSFPQLIAKMLPNQRLVNLGVPAAGPERQYPIYRRFGAGLHPRLVVACLYLAADFENDLHFQSWLREGKNTDYNSYRFRFRDAHDTRWAFEPDRLFERSWLLGMARELVAGWAAGENRVPDRHRFPDGAEVLLYRPAIDFAAEALAANDARVEAMLKALETLREFVIHHDADLLVMLIPSKEELFGVDPSASAHNIVSRTRQRLEDARFPVLDLYPALQQGGVRQSPYFTRDIHLNEYGNRLVAEHFVAWFNNQAQAAKSMR
jgi:hypothetical protein